MAQTSNSQNAISEIMYFDWNSLIDAIDGKNDIFHGLISSEKITAAYSFAHISDIPGEPIYSPSSPTPLRIIQLEALTNLYIDTCPLETHSYRYRSPIECWHTMNSTPGLHAITERMSQFVNLDELKKNGGHFGFNSSTLNNIPPHEITSHLDKAINKKFGVGGIDSFRSLIRKNLSFHPSGYDSLMESSTVMTWLHAFNYWPEKKGTDIKNYNNDAIHAYFGICTGTLVTHDKRLSQKAQVLASYFGKSIRILSLKDLANHCQTLP